MPPPPDAVIFQLLFGKVTCFALGALARIGVADHMSDDALPVEQIAAASGTHAPSLYRVLRTMASFGVSAKFRPGGVSAELADAGFEVVRTWTDAAGDFAITLARRSAR